MLTKVTLTLLLFFIPLYIAANEPFNFGRVSNKDLDLEYYKEKYPDEPAIIIGDIANGEFVFDSGSFQYVFQRKMRIIILNDAGLDFGDIIIPFYESVTNKELIRRFRAHVYNKNGSLFRNYERNRVNQREGYVVDKGDNWKELRFALPGVKPGSIIEYRYEIVSDHFINMRSWSFQNYVPVLYSEYKVDLPAFYVYMMRGRGVGNIDIESHQEESYGRIFLPQSNATITYNTTKYRWVAKDIPPLKPEPYTDNIRNYLTGLHFELQHINYPEADPIHYTTTWPDVNKRIAGYFGFGDYLNEASIIMEKYSEDMSFESNNEAIWWALNTINDKITWNEEKSFLASKIPGDVLNQGSGNSAEINLMLVALLKNLGIEAYPVVLSTVDNGALFIDIPTITHWNYVIAMAKDQDENEFLLDATVPKPIPGYIPQRAINESGRIVDESVNKWVDLEKNILFDEKKQYDIKINKQGDLTGTLEFAYNDFGKYSLIQSLKDSDEEEFWKRFSERTGALISNSSIEWDAENYEPIIFKADFEIPSYAQKIGNELLIPALLFETTEENPFKEEERLFPVVYNNKINSQTSINLELEDNLKVNYLPENKSVRFSKFFNKIRFEENDNGIRIDIENKRNSRIVYAEDYKELKSYYQKKTDNNLDNIILGIE